jgi:2-polyprenyl-6-hydroxyphenyl methylase/3-demethylubiquinone-9 3-methyltransferase
MSKRPTERVHRREQDRQLKTAVRQMWALGDYHAFAKQTVWSLGPVLVEACGIRRGQRVLDVAAGSGNTAIRAAEAGAEVVASDLTPENFAAGRREAAERGLAIEWTEGDAEALPFSDGEFDVVTSSFGAIFAPDHQAVANEMVRVCRTGGTIGMINFRPEGLGARFFGLLAGYALPSPPHALPPLLWGDEEHVRKLFGERVVSLEMTRGVYLEHNAAGPEGYRLLFETTFGPMIAIRAALSSDPARARAFDEDFLDFVTRGNRGAPGRPAEYPYEYLLVLARKGRATES